MRTISKMGGHVRLLFKAGQKLRLEVQGRVPTSLIGAGKRAREAC